MTNSTPPNGQQPGQGENAHRPGYPGQQQQQPQNQHRPPPGQQGPYRGPQGQYPPGQQSQQPGSPQPTRQMPVQGGYPGGRQPVQRQAWSQAPAPTRWGPPVQPGQAPPGGGPAGPPRTVMPIGPGAPTPPPGPRKKSAAPWIAVAAVVVLGAAAALIIVLTNRGSDDTADPGPTGGGSETVGAADPGIREYPSFEVSIDPAEEQAQQQTQQQAQQVADSWVQALNVPDIDAAVGFMCQANQSVTESQLLAGIEPGSMATGTVVIQGKRAQMPVTFRETSGEEVDSALPMRLEDDAWKVCL